MAIGANMTKREQMWGGIGIAAIVLLGAYWYFLYKPKAAELAVTQAHVDSLEKRNQQAKADIAKDPAAAKALYIKTSGLPKAAAARTPVIADEFDFSQGQTLVDDMTVWIKLLNSLGTFKGSVDPSSMVAAPATS